MKDLTIKQINEIKTQISKIDFAKYENDFKRDEYSTGYHCIIYLIIIRDALYVGNRQMPNEHENIQEKVNEMDFWFTGESSEFMLLHKYLYTHNCNKVNQKIFNQIKDEVCEAIGANFNIVNIDENLPFSEMFGKIISNYKKEARSLLKYIDVESFKDYLCNIIKRISENEKFWLELLIMKNRFWFISKFRSDACERRKYKLCDMDEDEYMILIAMKEYILTYIAYYKSINKSINDLYNNLNNIKFMNEDLYDEVKSDWFSIDSQVKLFCSILYKHTTQEQLKTCKDKFIKARKEWYLPSLHEGISKNIKIKYK